MEWANLVKPVVDEYVDYLVAVIKDDDKCTSRCLYKCEYQTPEEQFI